MSTKPNRSQGFTLITALMLLLLLSGVALGLMYMVNTESHVGSGDLENTLAYHAAEGGMEKMTADLANLFSSQQAPTPANIANLQNFPPIIPGVVYPSGTYTITVPTNPDGTYKSTVSTISSGQNAGLVAEIVPMTLAVTAQRPLGDQVRMVRSVEVALIPVFQFGVFSDGDLSYFPGPSFDFAGRVHTNGNAFLADGTKLQLHSKVSAVGEVIRAELANGFPTSSNYTGPVYIPQATGACDIPNPPGTNCRSLAANEGSKVGGVNSANNPNWPSISMGTYNSWIINGRTGATPLTLPFVGAGVSAIQIIRRPAPGELPGSTLAASRLYNQSQIQVLISDTAAENHPDGSGIDADDIQLDNVGWAAPGVVVSGVGTSYFARANVDCSGGKGCEPITTNFIKPVGVAGNEWPLIDGWLRVQIQKADGTFLPVTREWLGLGFGRGLLPPNSANGVPNSAHPRAILIFQELADRNADGILTNAGDISSAVTGANSQYNWFPINFYDPREGEVRDIAANPVNTCAPNGVMNAVDLDVNNLRQWLTGTFPGNGTQVDSAKQNGYVLYFSDRRGMLPDTNVIPNAKTGEYGFEDVVNSADAAGTPNGQMEAPEDVDGNTQIDYWGAANVGTGFGVNTNVNPAKPNPFSPRVACATIARKNRVSGARRVLRLVNGTRGNVPGVKPTGKGGFTVASENPVYILGDYNAKTSDNAWVDANHAAAAVISDSVTLLSNKWGTSWAGGSNQTNGDLNSFQNPTAPGNRAGTETRYRLAIAAGKNINFPRPLTWSPSNDFGTDGGLHNFLRYIEAWGTPLHYQGSLVSLYYSGYATGIFKCCTTVYSPPQRDYSFDTLFLNPVNLPPATPMFRDVDNVSYRQDFTPN